MQHRHNNIFRQTKPKLKGGSQRTPFFLIFFFFIVGLCNHARHVFFIVLHHVVFEQTKQPLADKMCKQNQKQKTVSALKR